MECFVIGKYKDPRDVNSQQRKAKRNEFLNVLTKDELSQMIQAGKNPFNTDHTINISNTDSWLSSKNFAAMMKKNQQNNWDNWDNWANARQSYWLKREVLTHNEFIYLLKEKEPRSLVVKPTQFDYFPLDFCVFHDETVRIIEDSRVLKKITPVYHDVTNYLKIGFKTIDLVKLALSKNIHVPSWLIPKINDSDEKVKKNLLNEYSIDSYALNGMDDRLKRKQKLPKEPISLNLVYKPGKSFKQQKWDEIPAVDQKHWKHRDTLTIIELAFILKGKEPLPQATQYNILNLYPLGFCEFVGKLLEQADSSWKIGKLIEINLPAPYGEEWADPSEFERKELIKWTKSKQYEVPACNAATSEASNV